MKEKPKLALWMSFFTLSVLTFITPDVARAQEDAKVPMCRGDQLLAYYQGWGLSMAHDYAKVVFRNRSASACRLRGLPRIRQFDEHGKEIHGGIPGGCHESFAPEPCDDLVLKPDQRASLVIGMLDGTGLENPICAIRLVLDSPRPGMQTWTTLALDGFVSCGSVEPHALEYQTTPGVEIDPYMDMRATFPRGVPSGDWFLNLIDAHAAVSGRSGPYAQGYDPPFALILQNRNDSLLLPAAETWCGGGVTMELRGPGGNLLGRTPPSCEAPKSRDPMLAPPRYTLALTLYLYDLGYDLSPPGEYKLRVRWRLASCTRLTEGDSCPAGTSTESWSVVVESNEIVFTVAK